MATEESVNEVTENIAKLEDQLSQISIEAGQTAALEGQKKTKIKSKRVPSRAERLIHVKQL